MSSDKYKWLNAREHVLLRPDTYAGAVVPYELDTHILSHDADATTWTRRMIKVLISPALCKVVDEVLTNAADNSRRCRDQKVVEAKFSADGVFEVYNDGQTIPVQHWPGTERYMQEILFAEMMTGENFDDSQQRTGGGRNGMGVKLVGILSHVFEVECINMDNNQLFYKCTDPHSKLLSNKYEEGDANEAFANGAVTCAGLQFARLDGSGRCTKDTLIRHKGAVYRNVGPIHYTQRFTDNLKEIEAPVLSKPTGKNAKRSSTRIKWRVDLSRLGMTAPLSDDVLDVLRTRVVDIAACTGKSLAVSVDGRKIPLKSIKDYGAALGGVMLGRDIFQGENGVSCIEVCVLRADETNPPCTVGFVNGIRCSAGKHVDLVWKRILESLSHQMTKRLKRSVTVKPNDVRDLITLVIDVVAPNPAFSSQTKEKLDSSVDKLGLLGFQLSPSTVRGFERTGIIDALAEAQNRQDEKSIQKSIKSDRTRTASIPKYEKALKLHGTKSTSQPPCCLYLTEGDSAKALVVAGFGVIGRDYNGVFPLRGKLVNVHNMAAKKAIEHREIKHLTQILGLDPSLVYTREKGLALPYRHLVIFTDQDTDGAHIMGLVLNWLNAFYPSLLTAVPDFVYRFATPIIRARVGAEQRAFFSQPEYDLWIAGRQPSSVKYFKGLGTSNSEDAKIYFRDLPNHRFPVNYTGAPCADAISLFFASGRTDDRKKILTSADPSAYLRYGVQQITYDTFLRTELVQHGVADNRRSLASGIDGMKPSQRKILYVALTRPPVEVKVAQFAAAVAEKTHYHHGEKSLVQTMVAMAQNWVGANNIALLKPNGMFGSRHNVRTEHSAERYIFTERHPIARALFPPLDDCVLEYEKDDGHVVEPKHFVPVISTLLCNGSEGIGTGWKNICPAYAPRDVIANTRRLIADPSAPLAPMKPMFVGFTGSVEADGDEWIFKGKAVVESATIVRITELPPKTWTEVHIEWIREHLIGDKPHQFVSSVENHSLLHTVSIIVKTKQGGVSLHDRDLLKDLKLTTRVSMQFLNFFDADARLQHYSSVFDIMRAHAVERKKLYRARIDAQIARLRHDERIARNRACFVDEIRTGTLNPIPMAMTDVLSHLQRGNYYKDSEKNGSSAYDYLLKLNLSSLTHDKSAALRDDAERLAGLLAELKNTKLEDVWRSDLLRLEEALKDYDTEQDTIRCNVVEPTDKKKKKKQSQSGSSGSSAEKKHRAT